MRRDEKNAAAYCGEKTAPDGFRPNVIVIRGYHQPRNVRGAPATSTILSSPIRAAVCGTHEGMMGQKVFTLFRLPFV